jgi:tetratricopeptide (TPR) repeat protein
MNRNDITEKIITAKVSKGITWESVAKKVSLSKEWVKARVLNFVGGYEQALSFLQPYLDHNPENDALWVVLAEIHEYRDNYDPAIEALQRAKRLLECSRSKHRSDNLQFVDKKLQQLSAMR